MARRGYAGPIAGSYWVEPGRLLAGPYPDRTADVEALLDAGVDLFVDLTCDDEGWPDYWSGLPAGSHRRFSFRDAAAPPREAMERVLDFVAESLREGRTIYVHCRGGRGRTGSVVGCYLVADGVEAAEALAALPKWCGHPRSPETDDQLELVRTWSTDARAS
jgi:hypothetical protein